MNYSPKFSLAHGNSARRRIPAGESNNAIGPGEQGFPEEERAIPRRGVEKFRSHLNYLAKRIRKTDPHPHGKHYRTISIFNGKRKKCARPNELSPSENRAGIFPETRLPDVSRGAGLKNTGPAGPSRALRVKQ